MFKTCLLLPFSREWGLMMEAVITRRMSVSFYQTVWHNIVEDGHICTHCCENLKSHIVFIIIILLI
jgi:hypothetical protein